MNPFFIEIPKRGYQVKRGRRRKRPKVPKEQVEAMKMYMEGIVSNENIAKYVGASLRTIQRWIRKYGWKEMYKVKYDQELPSTEDWDKYMAYKYLHRIPNKIK